MPDAGALCAKEGSKIYMRHIVSMLSSLAAIPLFAVPPKQTQDVVRIDSRLISGRTNSQGVTSNFGWDQR